MKLKKNIGTVDSIIRIVIAVVIGFLGIYFKSWWGLIGLLPLITALIRFCPAYYPFGLSTCKCCCCDKSKEEEKTE